MDNNDAMYAYFDRLDRYEHFKYKKTDYYETLLNFPDYRGINYIEPIDSKIKTNSQKYNFLRNLAICYLIKNGASERYLSKISQIVRSRISEIKKEYNKEPNLNIEINLVEFRKGSLLKQRNKLRDLSIYIGSKGLSERKLSLVFNLPRSHIHMIIERQEKEYDTCNTVCNS